MAKSLDAEGGARGIEQLLAACRWGHRFYSEAAELSKSKRLTMALQKLELHRAALASELQGWTEPTSWSGATLIPLIRAARHDDARILELCDRMDQFTIAAYEVELRNDHQNRVQAMLVRHLEELQSSMRGRSDLMGGTHPV